MKCITLATKYKTAPYFQGTGKTGNRNGDFIQSLPTIMKRGYFML